MHISLDSALGRQKRLNSVGESVLQIAPDAAAAYSLRSLTGGDPDVVRVRRESDNTEKDFSGSQIESGEMARWVNEQPTLPLDLRELDTNTGERDGALIEAAAAYSLRKLKEDFTGDVVEVRRNVDGETEGFTAAEVTDGTLESFVNASFDDELPLDQATGAAAAYSLRDLSSSYTGNVVEVRRSSDDAVQAFTASEVADGTLEDWVNTDVTIYQSDFSSSTNGWNGASVVTLAGNQDEVSDGTTSKDNVLKLTKNQDSQAYIARDQGVIAGLTYTVSGSFYAPSSNTGVDGILIKDGIAGGSLSDYPSGYLTSNGVWTDFSFSYTATASGSQRINMGISSLGYGNPNGSSAGSAGDVVYISDLQFVETTSNGHVKTWYDQSGSDNDAVQTDTAKQPTIVEDGNLLKDSNNKPEIDFDGTDDFLSSDHILSQDDLLAVHAVAKFNNNTDRQGLVGNTFYVSTSNNGGFNLENKVFNLTELAATLDDASVSTYAIGSSSDIDTSNEQLFTLELASGTLKLYTDGTELDSVSAQMNSEDGGGTLAIGASSDGASPLDGTVQEIIIYNSDQSDKRRAIEENIANHYDISLAAFSRDGTVSTWYDQSGSTPANHATQTDPTKQPKIVEGGNLLRDTNGNIAPLFDGTSSYLDIPAIDVSSLALSAFAVQNNANNTILGTSTNRSLYFYSNSAGLFARNTPIAETFTDTTGGVHLHTCIHDGTTNIPNVSFYKDGVASTQTSSQQGDENVLNPFIYIGKRSTSNPSSYLSQHLAEFIIYNSDQTANRTALEANIGETYGITAIPAADDTVNGFVQTWYDQSGSVPANDAVQTTAANQPKIVGEVTSGQPHEFLGALVFDGTDDYLDLTTNLTAQPYSTFSVYSATQNSSYIYGGATLPVAGRSSIAKYIVHHGNGLAPATHPSTEILGTYFANSTTSEIFSNGLSVGSGDAGNTANTIQYVFGRPASAFGGTAKELIIYNSDQSSNRPAIEANINNQYDIY